MAGAPGAGTYLSDLLRAWHCTGHWVVGREQLRDAHAFIPCQARQGNVSRQGSFIWLSGNESPAHQSDPACARSRLLPSNQDCLSITFFFENWQKRDSAGGLLAVCDTAAALQTSATKSRESAYKLDKMGVGRRMKKQGPPEPLSEAHYANLKRKKGLPVDDTPVEAHYTKKRRTSSAKLEKPTKRARGEPAKDAVASKQANGTKKGPGASDNGLKAAKGKSKKAAVPEPDSDEEMDDEFDVSDLKDASGLDLEEPTLGDDFLDSGDDSVYDSDQDNNAKKEKFVFSDDEDDDDEDREEKLTAANIEGLSRKLDEKLAREAEENEAELREAALQTNIDGDKPNVLGDEDEEDELSSKTAGLLAPDLQMLRTRITETIRVLEDFANLAEEGRSRPEYTNQLLKDVCACMTYLPPWLGCGIKTIRTDSG